MGARIPAEVFPPGEFIKDEMDARGWTQVELAEVLGRPAKLVSELLSAKRQITPQTATELAEAFGTDPQFWMNLESAYQLSKTTQHDDAVARRARLYSKVPVKDLVRRGWIEATESVDVLEARVMKFLEITSLDEQPVFAHAAKATSGERTIAQLLWLFRVRNLASRQIVSHYSEERFRAAVGELRKLLAEQQDVGRVTSILQSCGVRFVVVEGLPGSKVDGACFWLSENEPVIGMSARYDRIDNFWFVLRHEIEHVLRRDGLMVDDDMNPGDPNLPEAERLANIAALDFCVPTQRMDSWFHRTEPYFSEMALLAFAKTIAVHPGIVAGQLCTRLGNHKLFSKYRVRIRHVLLATAPVDGWGSRRPTT
jgi:HTH-type transcriptional regulator/antitoxin HigA